MASSSDTRDQGDQGAGWGDQCDRQFCTVCQHDIESTEAQSTTRCMHAFHYECLARAMRATNTCPVCREELSIEGGETSSDHSLDSAFASLDLDLVSLNRDPFIELVRGLEDLTANGREVDINVSILPPRDIFSRGTSPPQAPMLPATPANILHYVRTGDVRGVEGMLLHNRGLAQTCDDSGDTLLHLAVTYQNEYLVRHLTANAMIHPNSTNPARMTPLHYAVFSENSSLVEALLDAGSFADACDASGKTPLMYAATSNNLDSCMQLLHRWANVNAADTAGDTAIHHAARGGCFSVVRTLSTLKCCRVDAENHLGETALHLACARGSPSCVRYLVIAGASQIKRDKAGKVPRQRVSYRNPATLAPLLDLAPV